MRAPGCNRLPGRKRGEPHLTHFAPRQALLAMLSIPAECTDTDGFPDLNGRLFTANIAGHSIAQPLFQAKRDVSVSPLDAGFRVSNGGRVTRRSVRFPFGRAAHLHYHRRTFPTQEVLVYSIHSRKLYS